MVSNGYGRRAPEGNQAETEGTEEEERMTRTCIYCGSEWKDNIGPHPENIFDGYGICSKCLTSDPPGSRVALFGFPHPSNLRDRWLEQLFEDITEHLSLAEELREEE